LTIINLVRSGFGSYKDILSMEKEIGLKTLEELHTILTITLEEEKIDSKYEK
jgi:hypothetical protein